MRDIVSVRVLHNETRDDSGRHPAWVRGYCEGDRLLEVFATTAFRSRALPTTESVARWMWEIANADAELSPDPRLTRRYREQRVRSLCVGDVVLVDRDAFTYESFSLTKLDVPPVITIDATPPSADATPVGA